MSFRNGAAWRRRGNSGIAGTFCLGILSVILTSLLLYLTYLFGDSSSAARVNTLTTIPFSIDVNQIDDFLARGLRNNEAATGQPTEAATGQPTEAATVQPTEAATGQPTEAATGQPTEAATGQPTEAGTTSQKTLNGRDQQGMKVAGNIVDLVVTLTKLQNVSVINMLKETVNSASSDLDSLLYKIKEFQKQELCPDCLARRVAPVTYLGTNASIEYTQTWNGYRLPLICLQPKGRLGNLLGEYATIVALHEIFGVSVAVTSEMDDLLRTHFPNLSLPVVRSEETKSWTSLTLDVPPSNTYISFQLAALGLLGPRRFLATGNSIEFQLFNAHRDKILKEFTFADHLVKGANSFLEQAASVAKRESEDIPLVFIGVHIRLTDYPYHMNYIHKMPNLDYSNYLTRAIKCMKSQFINLVFVVATDDLNYAKKFFQDLGEKNVFFAAEKKDSSGRMKDSSGRMLSVNRSAVEDMSLLAQCNHSIITLGTFSFWAGFFSAGITMYPDVHSPVEYGFSRKYYEEGKMENFVPILL